MGVSGTILPFLSRAAMLLATGCFFFGGLAWVMGAKGHARVLLVAALALAALGAYWFR